MIDQIFALHKQKLSNLSSEEMTNYCDQMLSIIYGSREKAQQRLKELLSTSNEADIYTLLSKELNFDLLNQFTETLKWHNMSDLLNSLGQIISNKDDYISQISNAEVLKMQFEKNNELGKLTFKLVYGIDCEMTKEEFAATFKQKLYFTKQDIASEFKTDKKTLRKWLDIIFPDRRYSDRKKLNILEYKEIFEKLFLAPTENNLDIADNLNYYLQGIDKGMRFKKGDLVTFSYSDYKTLSANAKKVIPRYAELNIFLYSIGMTIMKKLGSNLIFIN